MNKKQTGFTLIEISVVIVILAIIASLVFPSYRKLIGKAKQSEAKVILQSIYTAQNLYFAENNSYADGLQKLDIEIPADARYQYTMNIDHNSYLATAKANIDTDEELDTWTIDEHKALSNVINDIYE